MRITSIDIETTGLNPSTSQVLQIGAVIFDTTDKEFTPLATYNKVVYHREIHGEPFAIQMNSEIIKKIAICGDEYYRAKRDYEKEVSKLSSNSEKANRFLCKQQELELVGRTPEDIAEDFYQFLITNGGYYIIEGQQKRHFNVTGKNFWAFDNNFLKLLPNWKLFFHRRSFDPANLYYEPQDEVLPSLQQCKERCMKMLELESDKELRNLFKNSEVTHDALDDAMDVAKLVWYKTTQREASQILKPQLQM